MSCVSSAGAAQRARMVATRGVVIIDVSRCPCQGRRAYGGSRPIVRASLLVPGIRWIDASLHQSKRRTDRADVCGTGHASSRLRLGESERAGRAERGSASVGPSGPSSATSREEPARVASRLSRRVRDRLSARPSRRTAPRSLRGVQGSLARGWSRAAANHPGRSSDPGRCG